jgi:hypothetical protein
VIDRSIAASDTKKPGASRAFSLEPLNNLLRSATCGLAVLPARVSWRGRSLARLACEPSSARLTLMYWRVHFGSCAPAARLIQFNITPSLATV